MTGDTLRYFSGKRLAIMKGNVYLTDQRLELYTQQLFYETSRRYAYYLSGAKIIDSTTVIISDRGYFEARTDDVTFRDSVVILDPAYNVYADTLRYNLSQKRSYFLGPTWIVEPNNDRIYCETGWFDQLNDEASFGVNTIAYHENQILYSDSLYYQFDIGYGQSFDNMRWYDMDNDIKISGDYAEYFQDDNYLLATEDPVLRYRMADDSMFLGADILRSFTPKGDTSRAFLATGDVRIFKSDFQGICDSFFYSLSDSTFRMYFDPVIWNAENQLRADTIFIETRNNDIHKMLFRTRSFLVNQTGTGIFDQIKGTYITGYFVDGIIDQMLVDGSAESLYFAKDELGAFIGANYAKSTKIRMYFVNEEIDQITFIDNPDAVFTPIRSLPKSDRTLADFVWLTEVRPDTPESVRRAFVKKISDYY